MTRRCLWCSFTIILPKMVNVSSICHRRCCRWTSPILTKIEHHWWQSNMVEPLKMNAQHHTWHRRLARISHKILHHIFTCIFANKAGTDFQNQHSMDKQKSIFCYQKSSQRSADSWQWNFSAFLVLFLVCDDRWFLIFFILFQCNKFLHCSQGAHYLY